ncbi:hypothetical protein [Oceanospirillum sanctuarii]|uniref:hypothetical protein n=1 Tax=Oceanospirillum sanctuarii TaxID=1434821 RepID=UPI000A3BEBB8|nr:hypothetical protein [Oceanospirillum sanctuarii]
MSIQEIAVSNSQQKKIQKAIKDDSVLIVDDNGDLAVQAITYEAFKQKSRTTPLEDILGEDALSADAEYYVFSC